MKSLASGSTSRMSITATVTNNTVPNLSATLSMTQSQILTKYAISKEIHVTRLC